MRDLFPGWVPPDETTLARYWEEATFAVDASVLLDLYRFSQEARGGLLEVLRSFGDRLWVPHQVAFEFHRNRFGVLLDQRETEDTLLGELDPIRREIDEQLSQRLRGAGRRDLAPLREAIDDGFSKLREKLQEAEKAHTEGLGGSIREDPIYDEVVELCNGRIGAAFDEERLAEVHANAEERLAKEIPPGYLDAKKDGDARFGDVVLWHQLCAKANETGKPMVLIADDQKADWVWEVRGKTLGPRPELVAEMQEVAEVGFHIYTPARLVQMWEERGEGHEVEEGVLDEIKAPTIYFDASVGESLLQRWKRFNLAAQKTVSWAPEDYLVVAKHRFVDDGVELVLAVGASMASVAPLGIRIEVTDPSGSVSSKEVMTPSDQATYELVTRFPDQFEVVSPLSPGKYLAQWFAIGVHRGGQFFESDRLIAHTSFVVGAGTFD